MEGKFYKHITLHNVEVHNLKQVSIDLVLVSIIIENAVKLQDCDDSDIKVWWNKKTYTILVKKSVGKFRFQYREGGGTVKLKMIMLNVEELPQNRAIDKLWYYWCWIIGASYQHFG